MSNKITKTEVQRLGELETIIREGKETFLKVGTALVEIQEKKLYRANFDTFDGYCKARWGFTRQRAYQLINLAEVAGEIASEEPDETPESDEPIVEMSRETSEPVSTIVDKSPAEQVMPANEAQARELAKAPVGTRKAVMKAAVEQAIADGRSATAEDVRAVVQKVTASKAVEQLPADPEPEPTDAADPTPWRGYNARVDAIIDTLDQARAQLIELSKLKGGDAAFVAWFDEKQWRKSMDNAMATLTAHRVIGWASKTERAKLSEDRPFLFAFDAGKKTRRAS